MKVGITGHQLLGDSEQGEWVQQELDQVIAALPPPLIGISSLAAGADQLFATAILDHEGALEVIIPFADYESVFRADRDRAEFKHLLSLATNSETLEKGSTDEEAYFAAGKRVVDLSEMMIAVWNGKPAAGLGGTGDVVKYALQQQKRIIHLDPIRKTRRDYAYDVFVSYRHMWPDSPWLRNRLIPALENAGLKTWLDIRDGDLSQNIYAQTKDAIKKSRHAICVISPSYTREVKKRARMVAVEVQTLQEFEQTGEGPPITPLWLRGGRIPERMRDLAAFDWRKRRTRQQQWKRLLEHLGAKNVESAPPACKEICWYRWLMRSASTAGIALLIALLVFSVYRVSQLPPPPPAPVRLTMQKIAGANIIPEMSVAPSGTVAGTVEGEIPADARVAIYKQSVEDRVDGWQLAGSTLLNGQNWMVAGALFRQPITEQETRTTIQAIILTNEPLERLSNDEFSSMKQGTVGELSSVTVQVLNPQVEIETATLDSDRTFVASGTAINVLADQEELYFEIEVESVEQLKTTATKPIDRPKWDIDMTLDTYGKPLKVGDAYTVHVFLTTSGPNNKSKLPFPKTFRSTVRQPGSAGASH
jgi:hypothetical protein